VGTTGVTHFIEHLLFKGSSRYTAEETAQIFDSLGGELNAATSREYVVVYGRFLDEQLSTAMDVLVDMLLTPTFTDLDREREVVLEEIAMYEDSPHELIHDVLTEAMFGAHPLAHPVLGSRATIADMPEDEIRSYHRRHFRFSDMVVAAAGNVDHEELAALLLAEHGTPDSAGLQPRTVAARIEPRQAFVAKETEQMHVCLGGEGLPRNDERRFVLSVLDSVLGGSLSSRLLQEVREKRGLVYSIYSFSNMFRETGLCGVYFGCRPDRVGQVMETVTRELEEIGRRPVPFEELHRAKEHLKGRIILGLESTSSRMSRLGQALLTGAEILSLDQLADRIDRVTADDVQLLAQQVFALEGMSVVGVGSDRSVFDAAVPAGRAPVVIRLEQGAS
jgi:predicted Zn-dependent peptidase